MTNLVPHEEFALTKEQLNSGFMGVFNWNYEGDPRKTLLKVALGPIMDMTAMITGKMPVGKTEEDRKNRKLKNQSLRKFAENRLKSNLAQYTTLQKVNKGDDSYFLVGLPIAKFTGPDSAAALISLFDGPALTEEGRANIESSMKNVDEKSVAVFPAAQALKGAGLAPKAMKVFSEALVDVRYKTVQGQGTMMFLTLKLDKAAAQYITSQDWVEIRPSDVYPLMVGWVEAEYVSVNYGKTSMSMSKIATTLPKHLPGDERVDAFNIGILTSGEPIWIPKECDNTERYESMYSAAGSKENGEFALRQLGQEVEPHLPNNIPILTDWVNNKFTYSNSVGKPVILDLAHLRKCTASMALNVLRRDMSEDYVKTISYYAKECRVSIAATDYGATSVLGAFGSKPNLEIGDYAVFAFKTWMEITKSAHLRYYDVMDSLTLKADNEGTPVTKDSIVDNPEMLLEPIARFIKALVPSMIANLEALFVRYAVKTMTEQLGLLALLANYGADLTKTTVESNTINKAALQQGVLPGWTPPPIPLLTSKFQSENGGLLPHQLKIRNILRDRPDLAALPVDAGGGKSMLAITDVLNEVAAGESAPYLVMCPSHLVANYVSEIVEFTDGKVNVIPVTTYNIQTTGLKRFQEILETAPINTILVVDYDCLKYMGRATVYGTSTIYVYPIVEMIRRFKPGYVFMDESHFLRNAGNARFKAVMTLVADIKKKRVASGTMNPDSPSDLPGQMAILDPTIFGTRAQFNAKYGDKVSGNRVLSWKTTGPDSINTVLPTLQNSVVWAPAKRKEWACALPPRRDRFLAVTLTDAQMAVYDALFDEMVESIRKKAETDKNAKKLLDKLTGKAATAEDEAAFSDLGGDKEKGDAEGGDDEEDEDEEDVGPALQPYLANIERFVSNPAWHPYAKHGFKDRNGKVHPPLSGEDLISPKARELAKQLKLYLDSHETKALIFTNYNETTDSLFNAMPEELRSCGLLYKTGNKTEFVNRFKTDPKIRWMIGIRKSLEVGLNLQQAGYLVRMEGVWNPGEQEQGDSRIERPNFSVQGDQRTELLFDTIVANYTIDITKAARLRAKIVALAKFDNSRNPAYNDEAIPPIPVIPMNLETIKTMNDFNSNLAKYQSSMKALNDITQAEYKEYKEQTIAEGGFKFTQVEQAPVPPGAAMLARVPYAQGTELYSAKEMGLIRVDNYLGMELTQEDEEGDDETPEVEDDSTDSEVVKEQRAKVMGKRCHCEFGDGRISGAAAIGGKGFVTRINVALDDGTAAVKLKATNVFIMTRTETNGIDMRNKLAQAAGLEVTAPITVPGTVIRNRRITRKEIEEREAEQKKQAVQKKSLFVEKKSKLAVNLELTLMNGYIRLSYAMGENDTASKALQALGFRKDPSYYETRVRSASQLIKQAKLWVEHGLDTTNATDNDAFELLFDELQGGNLSHPKLYTQLVSKPGFNNFMRQEFKPSADKTKLNLFALVVNDGHTNMAEQADAAKQEREPSYGVIYMCLPAGPGHPASKIAISPQMKHPSTRWFLSSPTLSIFVNNSMGARKVLKSIMDAGIVIENMDELKRDNARLKLARLAKDDEFIDVHADPETNSGDDDEDPDERRELQRKTKMNREQAPKKPVKPVPKKPAGRR